MSQPTNKQNFVQTLLITLTIFMGLQLFMSSQQKQAPVGAQTMDAMYNRLLSDDASRLDVTVASDKQLYDGQIDDAVKQKKLTSESAELKKLEAAIIVADTQYRAGIHANDANRIRTAFYTLQPLKKKYFATPLWTQAFSVADATKDPMFGWKQWSGQQIYDSVVTKLSEMNRKDLVYGIFPGYAIVDFLVHLTGAVPGFSYALASFLLAFSVRSVVFPLSQRQLMFSRQMSQLSPLVKEISDKYENDPQQKQVKTMELYREYGINPFAGCWPAFVQIPLFLTVYQFMLRYQFEFQKGTFLWINPHTAAGSNGLIAANLGETDTILIVIYAISMMVSTLLTPVTDPSQAKQQKLIGVGSSLLFTFFMFTGAFPVVSGFVLYWVFTNMLSTAQSLRAYRLPLPALVKVNAAGGGVYPKPGVGGKWMQMLEDMQKQTAEQQSGGAETKTNGKWTNSTSNSVSELPKSADPGEGATGKPVKHKPKKRK